MRVHNDQLNGENKKLKIQNGKEFLRICCRIDLCQFLKKPQLHMTKKIKKIRQTGRNKKNCATNSVFPERLYTEVTQHCSVSLIKINPGAGTKLNMKRSMKY